jgi:hypothetical protein
VARSPASYTAAPSAPFAFDGPAAGVFAAALAALSGIAGGAWCMVTMIARAGLFPAHR